MFAMINTMSKPTASVCLAMGITVCKSDSRRRSNVSHQLPVNYRGIKHASRFFSWVFSLGIVIAPIYSAFGADLPNEITSRSSGIKLALIPSGEFTTKYTDFPDHTTRISTPFYLGQYEITQSEYESVMGVNPSWYRGTTEPRLRGIDTARFPVENITFYDAIEFCDKLSIRDGLAPFHALENVKRAGKSDGATDELIMKKYTDREEVTKKIGSIVSATIFILGGDGYHIPTESEWRYAFNAGFRGPRHFSTRDANITGEVPGLERTTTVGTYKANGFGIFDMSGNVSEWGWGTTIKGMPMPFGRSGNSSTDPSNFEGKIDVKSEFGTERDFFTGYRNCGGCCFDRVDWAGGAFQMHPSVNWKTLGVRIVSRAGILPKYSTANSQDGLQKEIVYMVDIVNRRFIHAIPPYVSDRLYVMYDHERQAWSLVMSGDNGYVHRSRKEYIVPAFGLKAASKIEGEDLPDAVFAGNHLGGRSNERYRYVARDGDFFSKFERVNDPNLEVRFYTYVEHEDGRKVKTYRLSKP